MQTRIESASYVVVAQPSAKLQMLLMMWEEVGVFGRRTRAALDVRKSYFSDITQQSATPRIA